MVWDPITGEKRELQGPTPTRMPRPFAWTATVLCAAACGSCNHLDCCRDPSLVVFVASIPGKASICTYSSEAATWSEQISIRHHHYASVDESMPIALARNTLYFEFSNGRRGGRALKYDLESHEASVIRLHPTKMQSDILITMEDGGLGCAAIHESKLYMWSRKDDHPLDNGWTPSRVIELAVLHPSDAILSSVVVTGYAGGVGVIFLTGYRGIYKVDLKNYKVKKVCEDSCYTVLPYMSFHTPVALGAASTGEGPRPHSLPQRSVEQRTTNHQESFATQP